MSFLCEYPVVIVSVLSYCISTDLPLFDSPLFQWMEQHLFSQKDVVGLRHNAESIESACDEMGFQYGDEFKWHRDVVQLKTRDAGEKLAVSFAVAKVSRRIIGVH